MAFRTSPAFRFALPAGRFFPARHLRTWLVRLTLGLSPGLILFPKRESTLPRELYTARLVRKECLSESAQCFHLEFVIDEVESFPFTAGQFVSTVAQDPAARNRSRLLHRLGPGRQPL